MNQPAYAITPDFQSYFDDSGYMTAPFSVTEHLEENREAVEKLQKLTDILTNLEQERVDLEARKLQDALNKISGFTKKIVDHANGLHDDFAKAVLKAGESGLITKEGLTNFFIQGWYHTRYTPKFEHLFTKLVEEKVKSHEVNLDDVDDRENKFNKMMTHDIDEEEGHELWALQDVLFLGQKDSIDVMHDVYPETKAIIWSQHDRLNRLPFIGFLGYSFYLEFMIATRSMDILGVLNKALGTKPSDHKFIYYHYIVDQGHAIDNIELLDRMVNSEEECNEIIDNMNFIHTMYKGLTLRSFGL
ncbi:MAG: hypothetical protein HLX50_00265 [Alteromonadaceae bacterium]|nr:hypothetical protein [Alteromonadaceae bacterium]